MSEREREGSERRRRGSGVVHELDKVAPSTRSRVQRTGEWITHDFPGAISPKRLLRWVAKRAAFALVRRHLGVVAAAVGTLVLIGTGGYFVGRRSRG